MPPKTPLPTGTAGLHGSELIRRLLADWYVERGLEPPPALGKVAEIVLTGLQHGGPINVWRHVDDGTLRARPLRLGSHDPNEERVATFRRSKKRATSQRR